MNQVKISDSFQPGVERNRNLLEEFDPNGRFKLEHIRFNEDGSEQVLQEIDFTNGITNLGKNLLWDVMFGAVAKSSIWYMGLIDQTSFSSLQNTDQMTSHSGWLEFSSYTDTANSSSTTTRPVWSAGTAASQSITNSSSIVFTMTGAGTVVGAFIVNQSTKGATSGTLWSTGQFGSSIVVASADVIRLTYTVSA